MQLIKKLYPLKIKDLRSLAGRENNFRMAIVIVLRRKQNLKKIAQSTCFDERLTKHVLWDFLVPLERRFSYGIRKEPGIRTQFVLLSAFFNSLIFKHLQVKTGQPPLSAFWDFENSGVFGVFEKQ